MKTLVMDEKTKNNMGILSFLPIISFAGCFVYYLVILMPVLSAGGFNDHFALNMHTITHYSTMFILLAISAVIGAIVFIYFLVHIARIKNMNSATKLEWILFMSVMVPVALPLFWYFEIRQEPIILDVYPTMD
ncbi:MAG: hypothetical protein P4L41_09055 [Flavipsychrobacter sp.]|nr:hypothetical protein [Flavipsychrobacter sp.]